MKGKFIIGLGLLALGVTSCSDEVEFDQKAYDEMVKASFVVENVDPGHNWATVGTANANITVNGDYGTVYEVGIYLDNPIGASEATLLYEDRITGNGVVSASLSLPISKNIVYVGVYDAEGRGMAEAVPVENGIIKASIDLGGSAASAPRRAAASTNRNDYIKTNAAQYYLEYLEGYSNGFADYYDMSLVPNSDQLNKQEYTQANNWQGGPAYGTGKHFVLPEGKSYTISSNTFNNAWDNTVIVVRGTLTIPSDMYELRLWGDNTYGQTIVVASGGKLICNSQKLTFANKSNIINFGEVELNGTYVDYANGAPRGFFNGGKITGTNGAGINFAGGTPYYNSGDIDLTDNGFIKFNANITFTNVGHIHAYNCAQTGAGSDFVNDWGMAAGAQNGTVYNLCDMTFEKFYAANVYVGTDNSLLYAKEGLFVNAGGQITLGSQAMIKCGIWYDNGVTLYGQANGSDYSVIKVTNYLDEQNGGLVGTTTGYVYCDINELRGKGITDGEGLWHIAQVQEKMLIYTVQEATAPQGITIPADQDGCNSIGFNPQGNPGGGKPEVKSFSMRYCFEDNFPDVGDYDFNDVVLTMTPTLNEKTLTLKVSLDAVGATKTIGAAIRIVGLQSADLEDYTVTKGFTSLPSNMEANYYNIQTTETFLTEMQSPNKTNSMVVVLFKDAHWAINPVLDNDGSIANKFFNTVDRNVPSNKDYVEPKEAVYTFIFKDKAKAQTMLKENLYDVFIVEPYNGGYWEVHTVQNGFKTAQVITDLKPVNAAGKSYEEAYGTNMPWAIMVPGTFKYPIEWQVIGKKTGGALSGAYKQAGHSFGEWAENSSTATDWYDYPTANLVFE
jgi:LruC domain-containing protein